LQGYRLSVVKLLDMLEALTNGKQTVCLFAVPGPPKTRWSSVFCRTLGLTSLYVLNGNYYELNL
jgi:hypothetical protein